MPKFPKILGVGSLQGSQTFINELWGKNKSREKDKNVCKRNHRVQKNNLYQKTLLWVADGNRWTPEVPSYLNYPVTTWFIQHLEGKVHNNPLEAVHALPKTISQCSDRCNELYYLVVNTRPSCDWVALTERKTTVSQARGTLHKANGEPSSKRWIRLHFILIETNETVTWWTSCTSAKINEFTMEGRKKHMNKIRSYKVIHTEEIWDLLYHQINQKNNS